MSVDDGKTFVHGEDEPFVDPSANAAVLRSAVIAAQELGNMPWARDGIEMATTVRSGNVEQRTFVRAKQGDLQQVGLVIDEVDATDTE